MSRPRPLAVTLGQLTHDSREAIAAKLLTVKAVRDAGSKAALLGMTHATIPLGPASLEQTAAAKALQQELKGMTFEWVQGINREGISEYALRIIWLLPGAADGGEELPS